MAKQPYIPLYTGDYLKDTRMLTLEVRGAWVDIMILMWVSEEKGTITGTLDEFALALGCSFKKANTIIGILRDKKICDFTVLANGHLKLSSRRMLRDIEIKEVRKKAGSLGGNPNLVNQKSTSPKNFGYPSSDNDNEVVLDLNKKEPLSKLRIFESIFTDEIYIEQLVMTHKGKDIKQAFEECYTHHSNAPNPPQEFWEWRQKLNTWLTIKQKDNATTSKNKKQRNTDSLITGFAARYGPDVGK